MLINMTVICVCETIIYTYTSKSHIVKTSFSCAGCGETFDNKRALKRHTMIHSGERPFICTVCGAGFIQMSNLKVHMRTHTGENPLCVLFVARSAMKWVD